MLQRMTTEHTYDIADQHEYVYSFYENCLYTITRKRTPPQGIPHDRLIRRKTYIRQAMISYAAMLLLYFAICLVFKKYLNETRIYHMAAPFLASIIFWPYIISDNSHMFYDTYKEISGLLSNNGKKWYIESAQITYSLKDEREKMLPVCLLLNGLCIVFIVVVYAIRLFFDSLVFTPLYLAAVCAASLFLTFISARFKHRNTIFSTICCGLAYYVYLIEFSSHKLIPFFTEPIGNFVMVFPVILLLFICGTAVYPVLSLFKVFYIHDIRQNLRQKITSEEFYKLQSIKNLFRHLTTVSVFAYFQLLCSVYLLGIFNNESQITILLFIFGSLLPLSMFLASDVFYKRLCESVYMNQIIRLDNEIEGSTVFDNGLFAKNEYMKASFSMKLHLMVDSDNQLLVAVLSPIVTTILAFVFPGTKSI